MKRVLPCIGTALAALACATPAPDPVTPIAAGDTLAVAPPPPPLATAIRLGPSALRYTVHRRLRVEQELAGQPPTEMSYRVFLTAIITGPADSAGYPVSHAVDSLVADSGSFVPPTVNFAAARGLRFTGRLAASGEMRDVTPSDSITARQFAQFLGNPRDFYPRLPPDGLTATAAWTDTLTTTERSSAGEVRVHAIQQAAAVGWEARGGVPCLKVEVRGTFAMEGVGEQAGQPYELTGSGTRRAVEFVSRDGRYLGGETRDSMNLAVSLPAQGVTIPIRQVLHSTVTVLP
ncbi:MAG: hypothetical protein ACREMJ_02075 [Gemmatimonadales bacterium]